ncbi:S8/S53 family peptidase [Pseudoalteromonas luteoviolacea]|nr:S8/S53 family peptidase [Pseudoalteromonas luteoviolacea]
MNFLYLSFLLLLSAFSAATELERLISNDEEKLIFHNFSKQIELRESELPNYFDSNINQQFFLNGRILVKASQAVKNSLERTDGIEKVQTIAELNKLSVLLVTPEKHHFYPLYQSLSSQLGPNKVQPDFALVNNIKAKTQLKQVIEKGEEGYFARYHRLVSLPCLETKKAIRTAIIDDGFVITDRERSQLNVIFEYDADLQTLNAKPQNKNQMHGTAMLQVFLQQQSSVSKHKSELIAIRQVSSHTSAMILAFTIAQKMQANVINSSWVLPFMSEFLADVIEHTAAQKNVDFLVFAAGNDGADACQANQLSTLDGVTVIGALHSNTRAPFSNFGECVDIYIPSKAWVLINQKNTGLTGTSSAAAKASGLFSHLLSCGVDKHTIESVWH